jgi:hypothetical protein
MRNGIYNTKLALAGVSGKGISAVNDNIIQGFDERFFYFVGHEEPPGDMAPKRRGSIAICGDNPTGPFGRNFDFLIHEVEESGDGFVCRGCLDGDSSEKISIQGTWYNDLP